MLFTDVISSFEDFGINEALEDDRERIVSALTERFYCIVSRCSELSFLRMKPRRVFSETRMHILETDDRNRSFLDPAETGS